MTETIVALSTPQGLSGVAVIRLSGPGSFAIAGALSGSVPAPRRATLRALRDPRTGEAIDRGLVLAFPGPTSFTGEDIIEFHVHGGRAVIAAVLDACVQAGARLAEAGEFTRRAFENGKLDLAAVEGLGDLLHAETAMQRRQAYRQYTGAAAAFVEEIRAALVEMLAYVEAAIDFADEDDVSERALEEARRLGGRLLATLDTAIAGAQRAERVRTGFVVVIAGAPNVGKSTLLNTLARRDVAIVSPQAGTTRDTLEVHLDLDGAPVTLIDTAGLRDAADEVEQEGVRRAIGSIAQADLVLHLSDQDNTDDTTSYFASDVTPVGAERWLVRTKADLTTCGGGNRHVISARTGENISLLIADLAEAAKNAMAGEAVVVAQVRQREIVERIRFDIETTLRRSDWRDRSEEVAEDIRHALRAADRIVGRTADDAMLDVIFRQFCIGK